MLTRHGFEKPLKCRLRLDGNLDCVPRILPIVYEFCISVYDLLIRELGKIMNWLVKVCVIGRYRVVKEGS